jgi:hypothetical protein
MRIIDWIEIELLVFNPLQNIKTTLHFGGLFHFVTQHFTEVFRKSVILRMFVRGEPSNRRRP